MTHHEALVKIAKESISSLFDDTTVDLEQTLESLEELSSEIDNLKTALKEDIRRKKKEEQDGE